MVAIIKKGYTKIQIEKQLKKIPKKNKSIEDYFGSIKLKKEPLEYQKMMRNEW